MFSPCKKKTLLGSEPFGADPTHNEPMLGFFQGKDFGEVENKTAVPVRVDGHGGSHERCLHDGQQGGTISAFAHAMRDQKN